jgi:hypothetical protein
VLCPSFPDSQVILDYSERQSINDSLPKQSPSGYITSTNKYDIVYDDNDSEEMSEREYAHYSLPPKAQARAHVAHLGGDQWLKELSSCNCAEGHCYNPWAKHTPHFSPSNNNTVVAKSGIRKSDTSEG